MSPNPELPKGDSASSVLQWLNTVGSTVEAASFLNVESLFGLLRLRYVELVAAPDMGDGDESSPDSLSTAIHGLDSLIRKVMAVPALESEWTSSTVQHIVHTLGVAIEVASAEASKEPVVRKQILRHSLEYIRSVVIHAQMYSGAEWQLTLFEHPELVKIICIGVWDVWSEIRKMACMYVSEILKSVEAEFHIQLYRSLKSVICDASSSWQRIEGSVMAVQIIVSQYVLFSGTTAGDEANDEDLIAPNLLLPNEIRDELIPILYAHALPHEQLSIREHAIRCYWSIIECFPSTQRDKIPEEFGELTKRLLGNQGEMSPYEAESLLQLVELYVHKPAIRLRDPSILWCRLAPIVYMYLEHSASTVRQRVSSVVARIVLADRTQDMNIARSILLCVTDSTTRPWWLSDDYNTSSLSVPLLGEQLKHLSATDTQNGCTTQNRSPWMLTDGQDFEAVYRRSWEWLEGRLLAYEEILTPLLRDHIHQSLKSQTDRDAQSECSRIAVLEETAGIVPFEGRQQSQAIQMCLQDVLLSMLKHVYIAFQRAEWELLRMANQVMPLLSQVYFWTDCRVLFSVWDCELRSSDSESVRLERSVVDLRKSHESTGSNGGEQATSREDFGVWFACVTLKHVLRRALQIDSIFENIEPSDPEPSPAADDIPDFQADTTPKKSSATGDSYAVTISSPSAAGSPARRSSLSASVFREPFVLRSPTSPNPRYSVYIRKYDLRPLRSRFVAVNTAIAQVLSSLVEPLAHAATHASLNVAMAALELLCVYASRAMQSGVVSSELSTDMLGVASAAIFSSLKRLTKRLIGSGVSSSPSSGKAGSRRSVRRMLLLLNRVSTYFPQIVMNVESVDLLFGSFLPLLLRWVEWIYELRWVSDTDELSSDVSVTRMALAESVFRIIIAGRILRRTAVPSTTPQIAVETTPGNPSKPEKTGNRLTVGGIDVEAARSGVRQRASSFVRFQSPLTSAGSRTNDDVIGSLVMSPGHGMHSDSTFGPDRLGEGVSSGASPVQRRSQSLNSLHIEHCNDLRSQFKFQAAVSSSEAEALIERSICLPTLVVLKSILIDAMQDDCFSVIHRWFDVVYSMIFLSDKPEILLKLIAIIGTSIHRLFPLLVRGRLSQVDKSNVCVKCLRHAAEMLKRDQMMPSIAVREIGSSAASSDTEDDDDDDDSSFCSDSDWDEDSDDEACPSDLSGERNQVMSDVARYVSETLLEINRRVALPDLMRKHFECGSSESQDICEAFAVISALLDTVLSVTTTPS